MTQTLFLAWQDQVKTKSWYTVGRLDSEEDRKTYVFRYVRGVQKALDEAGFQPLIAFPDLKQTYRSHELFPLFLGRLLRPDREEFTQLIEQLALRPGTTDPIEILALTGGERQTDNLEVFPKVVRQDDGSFHCRFFLHGFRHVNSAAQERLKTVKEGDELRVAIELNNPVTGYAVQLETPNDYHVLGWAPRYLIHDFLTVAGEAPLDLKAEVLKVNPEPAPAKQRVLVELRGHVPAGMDPMGSEEFKPLVES